MQIDATNDISAALRMIKQTPVGESGHFHAVSFFRVTRNRVTLIRDGEAQTLTKAAAAAELVWLNLNA